MSDISNITTERWFEILTQQCETTSITEVARKLEYARPTVSLVLSGNYKGGTDTFAAKVIATFTDHVRCPHLGCDITQGDCRDHQSRAMPTSNPETLRLWMACRNGCPNCLLDMEDGQHA